MKRTEYVIKLGNDNLFLAQGANIRWISDIEQAIRFDFMTTAIFYANCIMDLTPTDYKIELI